MLLSEAHTELAELNNWAAAASEHFAGLSSEGTMESVLLNRLLQVS